MNLANWNGDRVSDDIRPSGSQRGYANTSPSKYQFYVSDHVVDNAPQHLLIDQILIPLQAFSPCMVATSFLACFDVLNSISQIPCQVPVQKIISIILGPNVVNRKGICSDIPVLSLPFVIGTVILAPISADLIWAWRSLVSHSISCLIYIQAYHPDPQQNVYRGSLSCLRVLFYP